MVEYSPKILACKEKGTTTKATIPWADLVFLETVVFGQAVVTGQAVAIGKA